MEEKQLLQTTESSEIQEPTKKKTKLWLCLAIGLVLILAAAVFGVKHLMRLREENARMEAYRAAVALEESGQDEAALAAFSAMGDYEDAESRVAAIQTRLDFAAAEAVFTGENFDEAIAALTALGTAEGQAAADVLAVQKEAWHAELLETGRAAAAGQLSAGAWHTAAAGSTPWIAGDTRYAAAPAKADKVFSGISCVIYLADGKVYTTGETFGEEETLAALTDVVKAAPGLAHALFLKADGTVTGVGSKAFGRVSTADWTDIADIAAGAWHSVGLKADGTLQLLGDNSFGQCDAADWTEITAVAAGLWHTVGLRSDGTVVAAGDNTYGQCDVAGWTDIIAVSSSACTTVGLKADGTVVAAGDNAAGQCDVAAWTDVVAIAAGAYHTAAVRFDGTVVTAGLTPAEIPEEPLFASKWEADTLPAQAHVDAVATAYVEGQDRETGPWAYLDPKGAVLICIDDSEERPPFRVDMLATANAIPGGRVTKPDASGDTIYMDVKMPQEQALDNHAVLALTGDYIGFTRNRKGVMIRNGVVYYDRAETTTLALLPDGTLQMYTKGKTNAEQLLALGVKDSFSFGPLLAENKQNVFWTAGKDSHTMRVAFGYSDPYHYIGAVTLRDRSVQMKLSMIANVCARYGCRLAYNLDGGHSTSLVFMGKELSLLTLEGKRHSNIRGLSDILVFLENETVGAE